MPKIQSPPHDARVSQFKFENVNQNQLAQNYNSVTGETRTEMANRLRAADEDLGSYGRCGSPSEVDQYISEQAKHQCRLIANYMKNTKSRENHLAQKNQIRKNLNTQIQNSGYETSRAKLTSSISDI